MWIPALGFPPARRDLRFLWSVAEKTCRGLHSRPLRGDPPALRPCPCLSGISRPPGATAFRHGPLFRDALLTCAGVITSVPLLLFAFGAARIPLITVGLLQYVSPSLSFALGVLVYGEVFDVTPGVTFGAIWLGLGLYTPDAFLWSQRRPSPAPQEEPPSPQKGA